MNKFEKNRRFILKCTLLLLVQFASKNDLSANQIDYYEPTYYPNNAPPGMIDGYYDQNSWNGEDNWSSSANFSYPPTSSSYPPLEKFREPRIYREPSDPYYDSPNTDEQSNTQNFSTDAVSSPAYYDSEKHQTNSTFTPHPGPTPARAAASKEAGQAVSYSFGNHTYTAEGELAEADPIISAPSLINQPEAVEHQLPNPALFSPDLLSPTHGHPTEDKSNTPVEEPAAESAPSSPNSNTESAPKNNPPALNQPSSIPQPQQASAPSSTSRVITPTTPQEAPNTPNNAQVTPASVGPINFNNVSIIEYIRFISRVSNKNFFFEDEDLQFTVTIVSEEPTPVTNLMTALLQELKIRDLSLIEQGNSIIIHRNPRVRAPGHIVWDAEGQSATNAELITRVFRLNTLDPLKATEILKPLLSDDALVEVLRDTNNLIITDLSQNIDKIARLITSLDSPNSGVTVGQYVVHSGFVDSLVDLASRILFPIAQGNPFVLVPHAPSNSIYIVSNAFIVEKALAILQNLDNNEGKTKIFTMDKLQPGGYDPETGTYGIAGKGKPAANSSQAPVLPTLPPEFPPGSIGRGPSVYNEMSEFLPGGISAASRYARELPAGHIERTVFFIYKLKYRRGDQIDVSLRKIASSLMTTGIANIDLVSAINSVQWIESSNSLIFTGTVTALEKIKDLILEIDTPLHQVYIEMLILDTTLEDSLQYGVDWGVLFGGGNTSGGETFLTPPEGRELLNTLNPNVNVLPNAKSLLNGEGFNLGIIGKHLTHNGLHFSTITALVRALHKNTKAHIILNPRILTEDNVTAEVFVGETDRYKTQSISNDFGNVITNNFQFIDVGTTLRVTPLIGNNGIITLDVIEEVTSPSPEANVTSSLSDRTDVNLVSVLLKNRSTTRLHVPNGFFVVMSGIIHTRESNFKNEIPCLGMIPIIGGAGKFKKNNDHKRNLMIFIRPVIVDTELELECITKRQQDVFRDKGKSRRDWNYEIDEALDFFNICPTDPDEIPCQLK